MVKPANASGVSSLLKKPTGIEGIDDITYGGLPAGRPTLLCGSAGCGKTLLAIQFLVNGINKFNEPGLFVSFEENENELITNASSLNFNLQKLIDEEKLAIEHIYIDRNEFEETGTYNLDGLFIRLDYMIKTYSIKRVVIDTIEVLFTHLANIAILRSELQRLFRWLKEKNITAIITAEAGENTLSRHGLEEYVADCVIFLDNRVQNQITTRRLRVVKYRGSSHGTNEYPFLINDKGIFVLPITSMGLNYIASNDFISTGIPRLDAMLDGKGFHKGSSILISGVAGTGKTSLASMFAHSTCLKGERCLYLGYEESKSQIVRNMKSIKINFLPYLKKELIKFHTVRPTFYGLEEHLIDIYSLIDDFKPAVVIVDPINNLKTVGNPAEVKAMLSRLIDMFKMKQITAVFTNLSRTKNVYYSEESISSLMDTWLLVQNIHANGENNRIISVLKSRGMKHSNQIREMLITNNGIDFADVYVGKGEVLTGSARIAQQAIETQQEINQHYEIKSKQRESLYKMKTLEAQINTLQLELEMTKDEMQHFLNQKDKLEKMNKSEQEKISTSRMADKVYKVGGKKKKDDL